MANLNPQNGLRYQQRRPKPVKTDREAWAKDYRDFCAKVRAEKAKMATAAKEAAKAAAAKEVK